MVNDKERIFNGQCSTYRQVARKPAKRTNTASQEVRGVHPHSLIQDGQGNTSDRSPLTRVNSGDSIGSSKLPTMQDTLVDTSLVFDHDFETQQNSSPINLNQEECNQFQQYSISFLECERQ